MSPSKDSFRVYFRTQLFSLLLDVFRVRCDELLDLNLWVSSKTFLANFPRI